MNQGGQDGREKALQLHRAGQLGPARAAYEALLAHAPGDADLLGLAGVLALQEERTGDAEALLGRSLEAGGEARIQLRNLNNYLVLLTQAEREEDARALVAGDLPDWPGDAAPDAAERGTVLSLTEALICCGQPGKARRLLDRALPERSGDAAALNLDGRLRLDECDADAAADILERAAELAPDDCQPLIALSYAQDQLGQRDAGRATADRISRGWAVYSAPPRASQRATMLVLNPAPRSVSDSNYGLREFHFSGNYASQISTLMRDEYRFLSLFADLPQGELPERLPAADVVLNNLVNSESMNIPGRLDIVRAAVERIGRPVINHPDQVFQTTRQKNALLLEDMPNLKVPRIERYRTDLASVEEIAAHIEDRFDFPVILRKCLAHDSSKHQYSVTGRVAVLAEDGGALRNYLTTLGWLEIYAIEYVHLRKKTGHFRKIRAALTEDEVIIAIPGFTPEWIAGSGRGRQQGIDYYRAHPETIDECRRIVLDPEGFLGADCLRTLEAIRDRIPLDLFGVDFDIDDAGQVVFFEANAAMNLLKHSNEPEDVTLPDAPFERIKAAFRRAVDRRIAELPLRPA